MNMLFCGEIGVGKSTLIQKLLDTLNEPVYGFYTVKAPFANDGQSRVYLHKAGVFPRLFTDENCIGICADDKRIPRPWVFDSLGNAILENIPAGSVVVMDELGVLESRSPVFCQRVISVLDGPYRVLGAVKTADTPFLNSVRSHRNCRTHHITPQNRDVLFDICKTALKEAEF